MASSDFKVIAIFGTLSGSPVRLISRLADDGDTVVVFEILVGSKWKKMAPNKGGYYALVESLEEGRANVIEPQTNF